MFAYAQIAERLFGRAHAIEPMKFRAILDGPLVRRILSGDWDMAASKTLTQQVQRQRPILAAGSRTVNIAPGVSFAITSDGVAVIPVMGVLSSRFSSLSVMCGWTTYAGLGAALDAALNAGEVRGILLDVESPGGEAAGMPDICDKIIAARSKKPIWAVADSYAFSAAYAIAGSASKLYVPRLCEVGSIGAVMVHVDESGADKADGYKYTPIFSGARKIDGWPHSALSPEAVAEFQSGVDHCRVVFAEIVGRQGRMSAADAMKTEAATYQDYDAVKNRLADHVGTFDIALASLTTSVAPRMLAVAPSKPKPISPPAPPETREDQIISVCTIAGLSTAETSNWLGSGKSYNEVLAALSRRETSDSPDDAWSGVIERVNLEKGFRQKH